MQTQQTVQMSAEQAAKNSRRIERIKGMLEQCIAWYAFTVPPQKERLIEIILERLGFNAYVPQHFRLRRLNSHQKKKGYRPYVVAAGYVFVGFDRRLVPWHELLELRLFRGILSCECEPIAISPRLMRDLFERSGEEEARASAVRLNKSIVSGDDVMIVDGPFRGHQVRIEKIDKNAATVTVELFQTSQRIEIALDALEAV
jgi:transcription antitermination factor NusG